MEVNGFQQLFGYQHSKYFGLFATEQRNSYRFDKCVIWPFIYLFITICKIFIFCIYSYYYNLKYTKVDIQYN